MGERDRASANEKTLGIYASTAAQYAEQTAELDTSATRLLLTRHLKPGARILDAGCGWGRDSKAFVEAGFCVSAFDGCADLAARAQAHLQHPVLTLRFQDVAYRAEFDAVWARASLLHLEPLELADAMRRLLRALRPQGFLLATFKEGAGERTDTDGRYFNDMSPLKFRAVIEGTGATLLEVVPNEDQFGRSPRWLSFLLQAD